MRSTKTFVFIFTAFLYSSPAFAIDQTMFETLQKNMLDLQKSVQDLQITLQNQNEVIQQQNIKIQALEGGRLGAPSTTVPVSTGPMKMAGLSQGFNPDIGVVATVQGHLTEDSADTEGKDTIALKEVELNFAHYVDPYSRLDAVIAFNDNLEAQNVAIEEAYYSHWGLPFGFRTQLGKFRAKIGKENLLHLDSLPTADYALVTRDFFGDEGLSSSGVRLVNDIPNPWDIPFEVTGEVLRGNNGRSFSGISRRPIFNTHAKTFFETSTDSDLELGWTTMFGDGNPAKIDILNDGTTSTIIPTKGQDRYGVHVFGADATWNWRLPESKHLKWQNEVYFQRQSTTRHANGRPWGLYTLLDYKFHPRFSTGLRLDYLKPLNVLDQHEATYGVSPYLTFWQSEFANFQIQYSHTTPAAASESDNHEVLFRVHAFIGAHQHPVQ